MNKILLALNAVLVIAVIGLYAMQFGGNKTSVAEETKQIEVIDSLKIAEEAVIEEEIDLTEELSEQNEEEVLLVNESSAVEQVAFVDFDRINTEWTYFKRVVCLIIAASCVGIVVVYIIGNSSSIVCPGIAY